MFGITKFWESRKYKLLPISTDFLSVPFFSNITVVSIAALSLYYGDSNGKAAPAMSRSMV